LAPTGDMRVFKRPFESVHRGRSDSRPRSQPNMHDSHKFVEIKAVFDAARSLQRGCAWAVLGCVVRLVPMWLLRHCFCARARVRLCIYVCTYYCFVFFRGAPPARRISSFEAVQLPHYPGVLHINSGMDRGSWLGPLYSEAHWRSMEPDAGSLWCLCDILVPTHYHLSFFALV